MLDKISIDFFEREAKIVARELLGKILVRKEKNGSEKHAKIVETEAYYGKEDPASRACRNGDLKLCMESEPGTILVYGVHNNWLVNFVTGKKGDPQGVLIRAVEPINFEARTNGPGLLTKALGITKEFHKQNIGNEIFLLDSKLDDNERTGESFRIGVTRDLPEKLRFFIIGNRYVSRKK